VVSVAVIQAGSTPAVVPSRLLRRVTRLVVADAARLSRRLILLIVLAGGFLLLGGLAAQAASASPDPKHTAGAGMDSAVVSSLITSPAAVVSRVGSIAQGVTRPVTHHSTTRRSRQAGTPRLSHQTAPHRARLDNAHARTVRQRTSRAAAPAAANRLPLSGVMGRAVSPAAHSLEPVSRLLARAAVPLVPLTHALSPLTVPLTRPLAPLTRQLAPVTGPVLGSVVGDSGLGLSGIVPAPRTGPLDPPRAERSVRPMQPSTGRPAFRSARSGGSPTASRGVTKGGPAGAGSAQFIDKPMFQYGVNPPAGPWLPPMGPGLPIPVTAQVVSPGIAVTMPADLYYFDPCLITRSGLNPEGLVSLKRDQRGPRRPG
jgi:hypothetical protein